MRLFLTFILSLIGTVPPLSAQDNGIEQASDLVTVGTDKFLRWHGHTGRTYFIQVSDPNDHLNKWTWAPIIESGNGGDISYEVDGTADKGFFRLKYTDQPTTDPDNGDFDGDSISNINEISYYNSDPLDADSDNDGMPDGYEVSHYLNPTLDDSGNDLDGDGLTNLGEYNAATEPYYSDTDGDGMSDGFEVTYLLDPLVSGDAGNDADLDGLSNLWEYKLRLNPRLTDSNANGVSDGLEDRELDGLTNLAELTTHNTDPSQPDTDMDTLPDGWELANGYDPTVHNGTDGDATNDATADPDGDGLNNSQEADSGTQANIPDSDGDGVGDGVEVNQGSDPNNASNSQPPPSGTRSVKVTFGDDSSSHSEKYRVKLTPLEGDTTGTGERSRTNREYGVSQTDTFRLPKGSKYKVELLHIATDPNHNYEPNPDFDHTLEIDTSQECLVVEDPESIMGTSDESLGEEFVIEGKDATLYVPLFEWITPKESPVSAPNDTGDGQNEFTYDAASPSVLTMGLKVLVKPTGTAGVTGHDGVKFSDRCVFKLPTINGSTFEWDDSNENGKSAASGEKLIATATYTTLPSANTEFGLKQAEFECDGHADTLSKGDFEVFFPKDATNHPGGQADSPNWYHYWKLTSANYGTHTYETGSGTGITRLTGGAWKCFIWYGAALQTAGGTWDDARGIDLFANITRHEETHRTQFTAIWGATYVSADDLDGDALKDSMEATLFPGRVYDPTKTQTFIDGHRYNAQQNPAQPINDQEDYCLKNQPAWTKGSANTKDWADPGMQHKTLDNPDD